MVLGRWASYRLPYHDFRADVCTRMYLDPLGKTLELRGPLGLLTASVTAGYTRAPKERIQNVSGPFAVAGAGHAKARGADSDVQGCHLFLYHDYRL